MYIKLSGSRTTIKILIYKFVLQQEEEEKILEEIKRLHTELYGDERGASQSNLSDQGGAVTPSLTNRVGDESTLYSKRPITSPTAAMKTISDQQPTEQELLDEIQIRAKELDRRKEGTIFKKKKTTLFKYGIIEVILKNIFTLIAPSQMTNFIEAILIYNFFVLWPQLETKYYYDFYWLKMGTGTLYSVFFNFSFCFLCKIRGTQTNINWVEWYRISMPFQPWFEQHLKNFQ